MSASKAEKIYKQLNTDFWDILATKVKEKYGIEIETEWAFLTDCLVITRKDGTNFTKEQLNFIATYSDGYRDAMEKIK